MITTNGQLYQWDTGRVIEVFLVSKQKVDEIQVYNGTTDNAIVLPKWEENGRTYAEIPDVLLQSDNNIDIYVTSHSDIGENTTRHKNVKVTSRRKPDDYVYTEVELKTWFSLEKRIKELENSGKVLPEITEADDHKVMMAIGGDWVASELPTYDGTFEIIPDTNNDIVLNTSQRYLDSNIKVNKVPYHEVSNTSNGTTVTIG